MSLFQLNVALPDRPGSLGLLASAIGAAGGDIRALSVVKAEDGKGFDDGKELLTPVEYVRARHAVSEMQRVLDCVEALSKSDFVKAEPTVAIKETD